MAKKNISVLQEPGSRGSGGEDKARYSLRCSFASIQSSLTWNFGESSRAGEQQLAIQCGYDVAKHHWPLYLHLRSKPETWGGSKSPTDRPDVLHCRNTEGEKETKLTTVWSKQNRPMKFTSVKLRLNLILLRVWWTPTPLTNKLPF